MSEPLSEILEAKSGDPRIRLELGQRLLDFLAQHSLPSNSSQLNDLLDMLSAWLAGSNYKVALLGLEVLEAALGVSGHLLAPYVLEHVGVLMERLGDRQETVRQAALDLLVKFMHLPHSPPQAVMERITSGFSHKQWLVRIGVMQTLQAVLKNFGPAAITLSKFTPLVAKLLSDPQAGVRDTASDTLVEMYLFVGDRLPADLQKKRLLPDQKAVAVFARFDDAKRQGKERAGSMGRRERSGRYL